MGSRWGAMTMAARSVFHFASQRPLPLEVRALEIPARPRRFAWLVSLAHARVLKPLPPAAAVVRAKEGS